MRWIAKEDAFFGATGTATFETRPKYDLVRKEVTTMTPIHAPVMRITQMTSEMILVVPFYWDDNGQLRLQIQRMCTIHPREGVRWKKDPQNAWQLQLLPESFRGPKGMFILRLRWRISKKILGRRNSRRYSLRKLAQTDFHGKEVWEMVDICSPLRLERHEIMASTKKNGTQSIHSFGLLLSDNGSFNSSCTRVIIGPLGKAHKDSPKKGFFWTVKE